MYPTAIVTDAELGLAGNGAQTVLSADVNNSVTTIPAADTSAFPSTGYIVINSEIIKYASKTSNVFAGCTRGADGSAIADHYSGAVIYGNLVAAHIINLQTEVKALETALIPGQHTGTAIDDNAAAGKVGEYIESVVSDISAPASGEYGDITSITLTPGDWDVSMMVEFVINAAVYTRTLLEWFIGTASGNNATGAVGGSNYGYIDHGPSNDANWVSYGFSVPPYRIKVAAGTTHVAYLKVSAGTYSSGTPKIYGRISARRMR